MAEENTLNMASHLDYFRRFSALSTEEAQAIADSTVLHTLAKGDHLRREGETSPQTYFVQKGCVRQYRLVEGEEITTHFYTEGQWIMGPMSFGKPIPATDYLICMEPTEVVVGDEEKAQALFDLFPRFEGSPGESWKP